VKIVQFEPEDERTTQKDWAPGKLERLTQLMTKVQAGDICRGRSLKYWENLKLKPKHLQMLLMSAAGFSNGAIASATGYTESRISVILNHPDSLAVLSALISMAAEDTLDVKSRIQAHAGEALDIALDVMRNTRNDNVRKDAAFEILKMAGYSGVDKKATLHVHRLEAPQAERIVEGLGSIEEDEDIDVSEFMETPDYEVVEQAEPEAAEEKDKVVEVKEPEPEDDGEWRWNEPRVVNE
jgi:hypothetical protein